MAFLSVVILTYNEEKNLPKCLNSVSAFNCPVFVLDSFSTDKTADICERYGAYLFQNKFETHTRQWEYALRHLPIKSEWVLGIDADQEILPDLVTEIKATLASSSPDYDGYYLKRRNYFLGKWIKHGGYYPRYQLKLFKRASVFLDPGELMDHHFYVRGKTATLKNDFVENNLNEDISFWSQKHIRYATLQASEEFNATTSAKGRFWGNQDERRIYLKNTWNRMPLFIRPCMYFFYRYFIQLGFLDGKTGLVFHFLQAFWYRFLIDAKIYELRQKQASRERSHRDAASESEPADRQIPKTIQDSARHGHNAQHTHNDEVHEYTDLNQP